MRRRAIRGNAAVELALSIAFGAIAGAAVLALLFMLRLWG